jgi:hypothetical protein
VKESEKGQSIALIFDDRVSHFKHKKGSSSAVFYYSVNLTLFSFVLNTFFSAIRKSGIQNASKYFSLNLKYSTQLNERAEATRLASHSPMMVFT